MTIKLLLLKCKFLKETINNIDKILFSEKSKENCINEIQKEFNNLKRTSKESIITILKNKK